MERTEFEIYVAEGFMRLPEWVRAKIQNVALLIEDEPSEEVGRQEQLGPDETLLGLYHGIPLTERGEGYGAPGTLPDTITLYKNPIEQAAAEDGVDVRDVIAETIWHEYAHHFGMDEAQVRLREDERA